MVIIKWLLIIQAAHSQVSDMFVLVFILPKSRLKYGAAERNQVEMIRLLFFEIQKHKRYEKSNRHNRYDYSGVLVPPHGGGESRRKRQFMLEFELPRCRGTLRPLAPLERQAPGEERFIGYAWELQSQREESRHRAYQRGYQSVASSSCLVYGYT